MAAAPGFTKTLIHSEGGVYISFTPRTDILHFNPTPVHPQRNTLQIILDFLSPSSSDLFPVSLSPTISPAPHHSLSNGPVVGQHGLISSSFRSEFQIVIAFITRNNSPLKTVQYLNSLKQLN